MPIDAQTIDQAEALIFNVLVKQAERIERNLDEDADDAPSFSATDLGTLKELRRMIKELRARAEHDAEAQPRSDARSSSHAEAQPKPSPPPQQHAPRPESAQPTQPPANNRAPFRLAAANP